MKQPAPPESVNYRGRTYRRTNRVVPISELNALGVVDEWEVWANPTAELVWGEEDCCIHLISVVSPEEETFCYEEVYPEPSRTLMADTVEVIAQLGRTSLFSRVTGTPPSPYLSVGSWRRASEFCGRNKRHNLFQGPANLLGFEIQRTARRQGRDWSVTGPKAGAEVQRILMPYHELFQQSDPAARTFVDGLGPVYQAVEEDLLALVKEAEFANLWRRSFFRSFILPIYLSGHIPCGWKGRDFKRHWEETNNLPAGCFLVL